MMASNKNNLHIDRCLVVGARGFVGQNLAQHLRTKGLAVQEATRETSLDTLRDVSFDCVFFCAGNSKTYLSQREPRTCLKENVFDLYEYLTSLRYKKWFHISSTMIYPHNSPEKTEEMPIRFHELSLYGAHKLLSERYVIEFAPRWVVVRPTGFFGRGLKKNLLFDLRSGKREVFLKCHSVLDYLSMETFCDIAFTLAENAENEIINVGSGYLLSVKEILAMKPGEYIFLEERFVDDRGISLERLRKYYPNTISEAEFRQSVRLFLISGSEASAL